ncbi:MAG: 6,7-dimethyl-8-ribityllumazine synthase [Candidatus Magasanikbacteria bacterium]|nr:6,7-dimethyl-8-ribityllumazine synthase [Candidatus Magasanikbacteria bacterium]
MQQAERPKFKLFKASEYRVGIAVAQFNRAITRRLLAGARACLLRYGVPARQITVAEVAGSIELPVALQALAETGRYNCLVALGAIIRGATPHFDYVGKIASEGILRVMLDYHLPVGFGVLTCDTLAQARARVGAGEQATEAALQSARLLSEVRLSRQRNA